MLNNVLCVGVMTVTVKPVLVADVVLSACPSTVWPGTTYTLVMDALLPFHTGDYKFRVSSSTPSVSLLDAKIIFGEGMMDATGHVTKDSEHSVHRDLYIGRAVQFDLADARNIYATDVSKTREQRGLILYAYIQVSPYASTKGLLHFNALLPNGITKINECTMFVEPATPSLSPTIAPTLNIRSIVTGGNTEKCVDIYVKLSFGETKQAYALVVQIAQKPNAELGLATVLEVSAGIKNFYERMPLLTAYTRTGRENTLSQMEVYLGVIESTNGDQYVTVKFPVKILGSSAGDTVDLNITPKWSNEVGNSKQVRLTVNAVTPDVPSIPVTKIPKCTLQKLQPKAGNPISQVPTVLLLTVSFMSDILYRSVEIAFQMKSPTASVLDRKIKLVGPCLSCFVPVGIRFIDTEGGFRCFVKSIFLTDCDSPNNAQIQFLVTVQQPENSRLLTRAAVVIASEEFSFDFATEIQPYTNPTVLDAEHLPSFTVVDAGMVANLADKFVPKLVNLLLATVGVKQNARQTYELEVTTTQSAASLKICKPRLVNYGWTLGFRKNYPEVDNNVAKLELGEIYHDGEVSTNNVGTAIGTETIGYFIPVVPTGPASSTGSLTVNVKAGTHGQLNEVTRQLTDITSTPTELATGTVVRVDALDLNSNSATKTDSAVAPGEVVKFFYNLHLSGPKCSAYVVEVLVEMNSDWPVSVGGFYVRDHGESVWCLNKNVQYRTVEKTAQSFRGQMNLGEVCTSDGPDKWIGIIVLLRPWSKQSLSSSPIQHKVNFDLTEGNSLNSRAHQATDFTVDPKLNIDEIKSLYTKALRMNILQPTSKFVKPGGLTTLTVSITVPPVAKLPASNVGCKCLKNAQLAEVPCTILDMKLKSYSNLAGLDEESFEKLPIRDAVTGQMSSMNIYLGNVVQTGISYELGRHFDSADNLLVTATVRMADGKAANNNATVQVTCSARFGSYSLDASSSYQITRDGQETMKIELLVSLSDKDMATAYHPGDKVQVTLVEKMLPESMLECVEQTLNVHKGTIFSSVNIVSQKVSGSSFLPGVADDPKVATFKANGFYFDQTNEILFELTVNPALVIADGTGTLAASVLFELQCMAYQRTSLPYSVEQGGRPARFVANQIVNVALADDKFSEGCFVDLGMKDSLKIHDCQISSSGSADPDHQVRNIRSNSPSGWRPVVRSGQFSGYRYATVLFGRLTNIMEMYIKLFESSNQVRAIEIYGTDDGNAYFHHGKFFVTYGSATIGNIKFGSSLKARGIRMVVAEQQNEDAPVELSIDLWGCDQLPDDTPFDPCGVVEYTLAPVDATWPIPKISESRVYLYSQPDFMFCDAVVDPLVTFGKQARCFRTTDNDPNRWFDLGPMISKIVAFIPGSRTLFGLGADGSSLVRTTDMGKTWLGVNNAFYQYTVTRNTDAVNALVIPWSITTNGFTSGTTGSRCTVYKAGDWHICYNGIYKADQLKVDWNSGCPNLRISRV